MIQCILAFLVILSIIALLDRRERFDFQDITLFFLSFVISIASLSMIFHAEKLLTYIIFAGILLVVFLAAVIYIPFVNTIYHQCKNAMYFLMWLPAIIRAALEGIYFLTEKGRGIERYFTHIGHTTLCFIVLVIIVTILIRKKQKLDLSLMGYVGAITSMATISFLGYGYQYTWSYGNFEKVYEWGNPAVAIDTYLYGKLPIIDYFSSHALDDVWTQLLYCFIHGDINGILVNPQGCFMKNN